MPSLSTQHHPHRAPIPRSLPSHSPTKQRPGNDTHQPLPVQPINMLPVVMNVSSHPGLVLQYILSSCGFVIPWNSSTLLKQNPLRGLLSDDNSVAVTRHPRNRACIMRTQQRFGAYVEMQQQQHHPTGKLPLASICQHYSWFRTQPLDITPPVPPPSLLRCSVCRREPPRLA